MAVVTKRAEQDLRDAYGASLAPEVFSPDVAADLKAAWCAVAKASETVSCKAHEIRCAKAGAISLAAARRKMTGR
jgi:hypothetical protein